MSVPTPEGLVSFEWLENEQILKITFNQQFSSNEEVDQFFEAYMGYMRGWSPEKTLLVLNLITTPTPVLTSYIRRRGEELARNTTHLKGRSATVMQYSAVVAIFRIFIEWGANRLNRNVQGRIFFDYDEGLAWLKELLPPKADDSAAS